MRKVFLLILFFFVITLVAGLYGVLHDQITYTLCPEYYTKFKFPKLGLEYFTARSEREGAVLVGFVSTWWVGFIVALVILPLSIKFKESNNMIRHLIRSMVIILIISFVTAWIGYLSGRLFPEMSAAFVPENVNAKTNFIAVGSMHTFSYAGGFAGLIIAVSYLIRQRKKAKNQDQDPS